jgi:hypothetical protein
VNTEPEAGLMDPRHATSGQVEVDLAGRGYAAEAEAVMDQARREPGYLAFTQDRQAWVAYREAEGTWLTGSGHQTDREPEAGQ